MSSEGLLFWKHDWYSVMEAQKAGARKKIERMSASDLVAHQSLDELAASIATEFSMAPPVLDVENIDVWQREVEIEHRSQFGYIDELRRSMTRKGTAIDVRVPFNGEEEMFQVRPTSYNTNPPRGRISRGYIEFTITGTSLSAEIVKSEIERRIADINQYLDFQRSSVGNFSAEIQKVAYDALQARASKLNADRNLIEDLGYRIRKD